MVKMSQMGEEVSVGIRLLCFINEFENYFFEC